MQQGAFKLLLALALLLGCASLAVVWLATGATQDVAATIAGAAIGLAASILIQGIASREQTEMIRAVTLDAEGITALPETFHTLKWLAFATKKPGPSHVMSAEWNIVKLTKIGGSGPRFVTYAMTVRNLVDDLVAYRATFVGTRGCVVCAIAREDETTSIVTFDTAVSAAGVYFGAAYLTDWAAERSMTLMLVGSSDTLYPNLEALPVQVRSAFHRWYQKIDFNAASAYQKFPPESS